MTYPKAVMTIKELVDELGFHDDWLRKIYRSRAINRNYHIAWKKNPEKEKSTILFDTEALEKYRQSQCTGI